MKAGRFLVGLLLVVGWLGSGCVTASLWNWGASRSGQGELLGSQQHDGKLRVVYELEEDSDDGVQHCAFTVPRDWQQRPMKAYARQSGERLLALENPLECEDADAPPEVREDVQLLEVEATVGRAVPNYPKGKTQVLFDTGARVGANVRYYQLGLVQLVGAGENLLHEIYGYDPIRYRWIRLGGVDLGPWERHGGRIALAALATPFTFALDAILAVGIVFGGGYGSWGIPLTGSSSRPKKPEPVPLSSRGLVHEVPTPVAPPGPGGEPTAAPPAPAPEEPSPAEELIIDV